MKTTSIDESTMYSGGNVLWSWASVEDFWRCCYMWWEWSTRLHNLPILPWTKTKLVVSRCACFVAHFWLFWPIISLSGLPSFSCSFSDRAEISFRSFSRSSAYKTKVLFSLSSAFFHFAVCQQAPFSAALPLFAVQRIDSLKMFQMSKKWGTGKKNTGWMSWPRSRSSNNDCLALFT